MAKNSINAYGALGKTNLLFFDPEHLKLVTEPSHPLYDSRVHLPVLEEMVLNIMHQGVVQPVVVHKNPETGDVEVAAGRQRVKNAREANNRLRAQGCEPVQVPAVVKRADGAALAGIMVSENELREDDSPLGRAQKMAKLAGLGRDEAHLALLFGCTEQTVRNTLALLDCTSAVRQAVERGNINVSHALRLSRLPAEEQRGKLAELLAAGAGLKGHAKSRQQRAVMAPAVTPLRKRKEIEARLASTGDATERAVLGWVLGAGA